MPRTNFQELLDAGVHFGPLKRKWNQKWLPISLWKETGFISLTCQSSQNRRSGKRCKAAGKAGRKILFVATKQAKT